MSKEDGLVGLVIAGSAALGGIAYGVMGANPREMPKIMYVMPPVLALGGFILGTKPNSPQDRFDPKVGGVYAAVTTTIFGVSAGLSYLVESMIR